jgi:hypothetical protein
MLEASRWDCDQGARVLYDRLRVCENVQARVVAVRFNTFGDTLSGSGYSVRHCMHSTAARQAYLLLPL